MGWSVTFCQLCLFIGAPSSLQLLYPQFNHSSHHLFSEKFQQNFTTIDIALTENSRALQSPSYY